MSLAKRLALVSDRLQSAPRVRVTSPVVFARALGCPRQKRPRIVLGLSGRLFRVAPVLLPLLHLVDLLLL